MERIATDTYTFSELIENGYTYVDKTDILFHLACGELGKQFFIARPRRFGKSLAVSTLRALFEGRRELFKGLAIEPLWDWSKQWPVLHLDMGSSQANSIEELNRLWNDILKWEAKRNEVECEIDPIAAVTFKTLCEALAAKSADGRMVLLIDEYDKPLLGHLGEDNVNDFRDALKQFYSVVKTLEAKQRFTFLTGVSKFSKVSVFSDLNNLKDLTMDALTATLFGYTHEEVLKYFPGCIHALGEANGLSDAGAFDEIVKWYDGYRFHYRAKPVINPVSLGLCFFTNEFNNYWSQTAIPTFLIDLLKKQPLDFSYIDVDEETLGAYEPKTPKPVTLLYQTGYLTIKSFHQAGARRRYTLKFPNREVEASFTLDLAGAYTGRDSYESGNFSYAAYKALNANDMPALFKTLRCFFAKIPYDLTDRQNEQMWQTIVYAVLLCIGADVEGEVRTNNGRIDMIVETAQRLFIIEFKLDKPAAEAIAQIKDKDYIAPFRMRNKPITLVGISFSAEKKNIVEELVEEV